MQFFGGRSDHRKNLVQFKIGRTGNGGNMPKYTLHYFDVRGLAELSRLVFAQAGQEFTDHRMKMEDWEEEKNNSEQQLWVFCYIIMILD